MDFSILSAELQDAKYSGIDDKAVADLLNTKNIDVLQPITTFQIKRFLIMTGLWIGIKNSTTPTAVTAMDAINNFDEFDITDSSVLAALTNILDGLVDEVSVPDFVASHKQTILSFGDTQISRAFQLGLPLINSGHVQAVRAG